MLSCGKVIGCLSKVTRHAHCNNLNQALKYAGIVCVNRLSYSDDANTKGPPKGLGTSIKTEEQVPPLKYSKEKRQLPACEAQPDGSCPPSCYEICGQPGTENNNSGGKQDGKFQLFSYWKQIATAIVIAGVATYVLSTSNFLSTDGARSKKVTDKKKVAITKRKKRLKEKVKNPADSSSIPKEVPYLLVGGGTAAFSAFRSIKSRDPKAKVLVITEEADHPYMRPPLSKELWYNTDRTISAKLNFKQWNGTTRSLFYEPPEFYSTVSNLIQSDKGGVAVATGWKVTKLDVANKIASLEDGYQIKYDKCLIATGASAKSLPVFDSAEEAVKERITTFRTKDDFLELENNLHLPDVKNVVIIGGGFLGSELACSLAKNCDSKKVFQVYKEKFIMAQVLPEYLSEWATKKSILEGVQCVPSAEVEDFSYRDGHLLLSLSDGQKVEADQVIVAVGVEPNTDLAAASQLEVNPDIGGFLVNAELEARSDVWIAGDAACFYDVKLGRRRVEHHDHAVVSGRLAGENMTGAGKPYLHQPMFWSDLGPEVGYEAIGIVDSTLPTVGVFVKASGDDDSSSASTNSNKGDFGKGVIFYLRDNVVVGIVLWNIFNRMSTARQVLARGTTYEDLDEVSKLFTIHDD